MHDHHLFGPDAATTMKNAALLWTHMFPHEYVRYLVAATLAYVLLHLALSRLLAGRKIRPARPPAQQMVREFLVSTRTAGIFAFSGLMTIGGLELGLIHIYSPAGERGWIYFAFTVIALIVLHDAWFYWTHRLIHDPRLFRRFHRTHHKSMNPSPWTAYSFDIGEAAMNALYTPLALMLFPTSDLAMIIFLTHMIVRNVFGVAGALHQPPGRLSLRYAWPSARWGSLPLEGGIEAAYRADIDAAPDPQAKLVEIEDRLNKLRSPFRSAETFWVEEIIDPRDTRKLLCEFVRLAEPLLTPGPSAFTMRP